MKVNRAPSPESVNQRAQHVLFVEGGEAGVDVLCLKAILNPAIEVKPLGACYSVSNAAQALHPHHPSYYFLIDRDHASDDEVEQSWANFPDLNSHNLLIWRRKEVLQGKERFHRVIEDLMKKDRLPQDFNDLRNLMQRRIEGS